MFKLIALKVLEDCAACAHKVLTPGELYFLCNDFVGDEKNPYLLKRTQMPTAVESTLYGSEQSDTNITINAIVGQNGDGKSSVVELVIRVLNNFACCFGYIFDQETLCYNKSVSAILYYEIDGHIYAIYCPVGDSELDSEG